MDFLSSCGMLRMHTFEWIHTNAYGHSMTIIQILRFSGFVNCHSDCIYLTLQKRRIQRQILVMCSWLITMHVVQRKHFFKIFSEESASELLKYWRNISLVLRGLWESWICDRLMIIITTNCTKQFESGWILSKYYYDKYIINICV